MDDDTKCGSWGKLGLKDDGMDDEAEHLLMRLYGPR